MSLPPDARPPIVGVILAGGLSRRMGAEKALLSLAGRPLLAHVAERLAPQVDALILNANGDLARFAAFGLPVAADPVPGHAGPLAGILAGLLFARVNHPAAKLVASVAVDTPFFPANLVARLAAASNNGTRVAVAASGGRLHQVFGVIPVVLADNLASFIATSGSRKVLDWLGRQNAATVDFPAESPVGPFFNINTPADLAAAEAAASLSELRKSG